MEKARLSCNQSSGAGELFWQKQGDASVERAEGTGGRQCSQRLINT